MKATRILIVGFGNPLAGDDGAGVAVVEGMCKEALPAGIRAEDGGSDSLVLSSLWQGEDEVWLVDATRGGAAAGTIHRLEHDEVVSVPQRHATAHQLSLPESLRWLAIAFPEMARVRYRFWGIEAGRVALEPGLTPAVAAAVAELVDELRRAANAVPVARRKAPDSA